MKAYRNLLICKIIKGLEENYKDALILKAARYTPDTTFEVWQMFFMTKDNGKGVKDFARKVTVGQLKELLEVIKEDKKKLKFTLPTEEIKRELDDGYEWIDPVLKEKYRGKKEGFRGITANVRKKEVK